MRATRSSVCSVRSMVIIGMIWIRPPTATARKVSTVKGSAFTSRRSYQSAQALPRLSKCATASRPAKIMATMPRRFSTPSVNIHQHEVPMTSAA